MSVEQFEVRYGSWAALKRDLQGQLRMGGLLLRTDAEPARLAAVSLKIFTPADEAFDLEGQVLQVLPGQGVAVQLGQGSMLEVAALREACDGGEDEGDEPPPGEDPTVSRPGEEPNGEAQKTGLLGPQLSLDPQELRRQIEAMTVNQKRQAALHGRREARLLLIKDINKAVHPFVVKNPAITIDEVEQIAKMPSVNPDALRTIAANREWTRATAICRALVRNPKTPVREALMLLDKLPMSEVRALAKSGTVKTAIQAAARKKVNQ